MPVVCTLALAQLRHHAARWSLLAVGVALVVAVPVITSAMSSQISAQTVRRVIDRLDLADHTLLVSQQADSVFNRATPAANDAVVRRQVATLTATTPLHELLFRPLDVNSSQFRLGAVDDLGSAVRVTSGRLPRRCTPKRCEVVVVGSADATLRSNLATLGTVVVGTVARTNPVLISGLLLQGPSTVVVGGDVGQMAQLDSLQLFGRQYDWAAPVDADRVVQLGVTAYVARSAAVDATLQSRVGGTTFYRPDAQLLAAQQRADVSARRFALLGGFAAVLLLGFAVVAAAGLRREGRLLLAVLRRRGATTAQGTTVVVLQAAVAALAGAVLGALAGAVIAAAFADGTAHGALGAGGVALQSSYVAAVLLAAAAAVVAIAVLLWADTQARAVWRVLDVVAVACLGAVLLAADRGSTTLSSSQDPLVIALPVLASVVAALVAARLWGPAARLVARALPARALSPRLGLLGATRRPLRPVATVAFLTAAVAAVVFAGAYRATLLASDADQSAYQVPLDATLGESPADLVPYVAPDAFGARGRVFGVLRANAGITQVAGAVDAVPLVAVDRASLPLMARWQRVTGSSTTARTLSARLVGPTAPALPTLPADATRIAIQVNGYDRNTTVTLYVRNAAGRNASTPLSYADGMLAANLPQLGGTLAVVAIGVDQSYFHASTHAHATGEGQTDQPDLAGTLHLGDVDVDGAPVPWNWSTWSSPLGHTQATASGLVLGYRIAAAPVIAAPGASAAAAAIVPVAVDAQTAGDAHDGLLTVQIDTAVTITARVVATLPRLAGTSGRFVLADLAAYRAAVDPREPIGNPTEFWVQAPSSVLDSTLPRFANLDVTRRSAVQADLDADPIGRGARTLLVLVALLCLAIAAVALVLVVVGERRDNAGELYAWEADGVRPAVLRRVLAVRLAAVAVVAVPLGVVAGLVLARVGTTLVAVDATGTAPTPPLAVTLGGVWTPLALVVGVGAGLLVGGAVAAASLRERLPVAAEVDLR